MAKKKEMGDPNIFSKENGYQSIEELTSQFTMGHRDFIKEVDRTINMEDAKDTEESIQIEIESEKIKTNIDKERLIREMRGELGATMKRSPRDARIIKEPFGVRLKNFFKSIFTKF